MKTANGREYTRITGLYFASIRGSNIVSAHSRSVLNHEGTRMHTNNWSLFASIRVVFGVEIFLACFSGSFANLNVHNIFT